MNFTNSYTDIDWLDMSDFRNIIVHEYFEVNLIIVWDVVQQELPKLKTNIELILKENN